MNSHLPNTFKERDIRSRRFNQVTLSLIDLQNKVAGQHIFFKIILILFVLLLCIIAGALAGFAGGFIGLYISIEDAGSFAIKLSAIITVAVLMTAVLNNLQKSILVGSISLCFIGSASGLLTAIGFKGLFRFLITFTAATGFILGLSSVSFLTIRFLIALVDVLFAKAQSLKVIAALITTISTTVGTSILILGEQETESSHWKGWLASSDILIKLVAIGGVYGLGLVLFAWLANALKRTPWCYPALERSWVLAVGSFWGTSFINLDLSNVNFTGTNLANTDLRAKNMYRTCFQGVIGLERARVDNNYLDLEYPKVQKLLTQKSSPDPNFSKFNLQGAYLQGADMRGFDLTDTKLTGADLKGADLRGSKLISTQLARADFRGVDLRNNNLMDANLTEADLRKADLRDCTLVRAQVARADFSGADMTGICIEDWSVSSKTNFTDVRCDYIFRKYQDGKRIDSYPVGRKFEPGEFASQFQQPENQLELVFKGEFDYTALSLTFDQLQKDKPDLNLRLQGIEQRDNLWVVKITSENPTTVETRIKEIRDTVYQGYEVTTTRLENDPLIRKIISDVANIRKTQAETTKEIEQLAKRIGNNFYFFGGTISNVTGSGEIKYTEASNQIRNLFTGGGHEAQTANVLLNKLTSSKVATTPQQQTELLLFILLEEVKRDPSLKESLLQQGQQIINAMPNSAIATAFQDAIAQLS